jgi:hypothetical protein
MSRDIIGIAAQIPRLSADVTRIYLRTAARKPAALVGRDREIPVAEDAFLPEEGLATSRLEIEELDGVFLA